MSNYRGGLPKKTETFLLFEIINSAKFRKDLNKLVTLVKTVAGVLKDRTDIEDHKKKNLPGFLHMTGVNISFSHLGFAKVRRANKLRILNLLEFTLSTSRILKYILK